jgi:hypothetical protein
MVNLERYTDALKQIPPPGCGCHASLLGIANLGAIAGLGGEQMFSDIRHSIPPGDRRIPDREIQDAINRALADHHAGTFTPKARPKPAVNDGKIALQRIINQGRYSDEADLFEVSPIRLHDIPERDMVLFLKLFKPDDLIFIGERHVAGIMGQTIRTRNEWIAFFEAGGKTGPHIILNPLNGIPTVKKSGDGDTLRGDGNVLEYRFCVSEFDGLSRENQIRFWSAAKLPIVALIDSGGKSIHAILDISKLAKVETSEEWQTEIKSRLYDTLLTPLGIDGACANPARLSRLPGHYREEKEQWQRLLWLSPTGRSITC